jgi:hypothetical protein
MRPKQVDYLREVSLFISWSQRQDLTLDSIFAISIGAHLGASNALLAPIASRQTWDMLALARDAFGEECQQSPSLSVMAESIRKTLNAFPEVWHN